MSTRLYRDGFQIERFYGSTLGELYDELGSMLRFALPDHSDDLQYHDVNHQLLNGIDGRFICLFGTLERTKGFLDQQGYEELSLGIGKAFYLLKQGNYAAYAALVHELDELLAVCVKRTKAANDL